MKICYLANQHFPSTYVDSIQVMMTSQALAKAGADVEVVIPISFAQRKGAEEKLAELASFYGIAQPQFRLNLLPTLRGLPGEVDKEVPGLLHALLRARANYDLFYTRYFLALIGLALADKPVFFELHKDLKRFMPNRFRFLQWAVRRSRFKAVVAIAKVVKRQLTSDGLPEQLIHVIPNGYDPAMFRRSELQPKQAKAQLGLEEGQPLVFYGGTIGAHKDIDYLLSLLDGLKAPLVLAGKPTPELEKIAAGRKELKLTGWLDQHSLGLWLQASDVLIIPASSKPYEQFGRTVLPIKTFQYLGAGRAIVAPDQEDIREVLDEQCSVLVPRDDREASVAAINGLLADPERRDQLGAAAAKLSSQYTWAKRAERLLALFNQHL